MSGSDRNPAPVCDTNGAPTEINNKILLVKYFCNKTNKFNIHLGLCEICVHTQTNLLDMIPFIKNMNYKLLKVQYPRSFDEVLALLNYSNSEKSIMSHIYKAQKNKERINYNGRHIYSKPCIL